MKASLIYKVLTPDQWATLESDGITPGSPLDQADGFVHFSTQAQLQGTLDLHYKGAGALILAGVALTRLPEAAMKWEAARDGSLFPHLYAPLPLSSVTQVWTLRPDGEGRYALPELSR